MAGHRSQLPLCLASAVPPPPGSPQARGAESNSACEPDLDTATRLAGVRGVGGRRQPQRLVPSEGEGEGGGWGAAFCVE